MSQLDALGASLQHMAVVLFFCGSFVWLADVWGGVGRGPRLDAAFQSISSALAIQNIARWPEAIVRGILAAFSGFNIFVQLASALAAMFFPFWMVHFLSAIYSLSGNPEGFLSIQATAASFHATYVHQFVLVGYSFLAALIIGIVMALVIAIAEAFSLRIVSWLLGIPLGAALAVACGAIFFFMFRGVFWVFYSFIYQHYLTILSVSLSGTPLHIFYSQVLMFPLTTVIVSLPIMIVAYLGGLGWTAIKLRRGETTFEELAESFKETFIETQRRSYLQNIIHPKGFNANLTVVGSFASGVAASFVITSLGLVIGSHFAPVEHFPTSPRLMIVNALFDGLTLLTSVVIFRWVMAGKYTLPLRLLIALPVDFAVAGAFALMSLYYALPTAHRLGPTGLVSVFLGHSPYVPYQFDFGPYFWIMHSSFLPNLMVWVVLVSAVFLAFALSLLVGVPFKNKVGGQRPLPFFGLCLGGWAVLFELAPAYLPFVFRFANSVAEQRMLNFLSRII